MSTPDPPSAKSSPEPQWWRSSADDLIVPGTAVDLGAALAAADEVVALEP
jgi:hypothetical protein